ncbi:hypothetical protein FHW12_003978 [Dokdonella fugitiva]|uniref:Bacteriophage T5 Orf172 DNA-binding domain-containing protein n=1 Tax=Dokdonella fugitiva TaxID=328517 RepID=A0A839FC82_9GAMM|nr:GIY-YIG nuclease family protein [Dokdonella fugitiva]MBA8889731.1 hypothetical protein [Dokdonella fugitiva]
MDNAIATGDPGPPLQLSRGRAFVYVLPVRDDTLFKIGFARDPLQRWRSLHPRCLRYFDFRAGALVETARVAQARALERTLLQRFAAYTAFAPLAAASEAGGEREWFRGVLDEAADAAAALAASQDFTLSRPIGTWLRSQLDARCDALFGWSARLLEAIDVARVYDTSGSERRRLEHALRDTLDACREVGLDIEARLPAAVVRWWDAGESSSER